ncbi:TIGR03086 family metal-binding protein [Micromonospora sp. NPDC048830]|uniref:TIGR03086 family metal-binding protein n=1 Tax=Micromonospora sp. NPDC048830 TaxID=3364257 RepID=UPI00371EB91F
MLELHRRTMRRSVEIVAAIRDDQWDAPTPCAGWTVRDLLAHMIRENRGFAAAAGGETADRSPWTSPIGPDPRADYAASAHLAVAAFNAGGVPDREFWLPQLNDAVTYPGGQAVGFHLLDYLVHGWDLAVATGQPFSFDEDVLAAVRDIAARDVPHGPRRHRPGATFAPPLPAGAEASQAQRLLAFLGRDPHWSAGVLDRFRVAAGRYADRPALVHNGHHVTYAELEAAALATARRLGPRPGVVAVEATHTPTTVVGLLGAWAAGGAYCPVDPRFPAERRDAMLTAAGCGVLLDLPPQPADPVPRRLYGNQPADDLAYVLFTSGSTGEPKPVLTPRNAIAATVDALRALFGITPTDRVLQFASLNWDTCFEEILPALTGGARLVFDDEAYTGSFPRFLRAVERQGITVLDLPTAFWHELVTYLAEEDAALPASVRLVVIGGEAANPARLADWFALRTGHARLLNTYGCTETTLITHAVELREPASPVPIGRPLPHVVEHVTADGELLVGGPSLAAGYRGLPEATAERFTTVDGRRFFRSGDRVSRDAAGVLRHEGRTDDEIKIRGIRVHPAEVEAHIAGHPGVAAVMVTGLAVADHTVLAAWVVPRSPTDTAGLAAGIAEHLRGRVPAHLVPSRIRVVPGLVHTPSGKIDRRRTRESMT